VEDKMVSQNLSRTSLFTIPALVMCVALVQPLYAANCTNATLQGNYGFLVTGTTAGNPIAIGGQISADGNGVIAGMETVSNNGAITDSAAVTGTYKIGSNCAGTATITQQGGVTANYNLVVAGGKVQLLGADVGTVESGFALPQGIDTCSLSKVKGKYDLLENGVVVGHGPLAFGGQVTLRGNGTVTGTLTGSTNGTISSGDVLSGAYKIGSRCFGAAVLAVNQGGPTHFNLVVVNGGHEVIFIQADQNTVVSGSLER
jgi:hypothetical protein